MGLTADRAFTGILKGERASVDQVRRREKREKERTGYGKREGGGWVMGLTAGRAFSGILEGERASVDQVERIYDCLQENSLLPPSGPRQGCPRRHFPSPLPQHLRPAPTPSSFTSNRPPLPDFPSSPRQSPPPSPPFPTLFPTPSKPNPSFPTSPSSTPPPHHSPFRPAPTPSLRSCLF
jgi:hypothetical protein